VTSGGWLDAISLIASELSTPVDVIEVWPVSKTKRYHAAAINLFRVRNGVT